MKMLLPILAVTALSGCSTFDTHLKTGCIWSCAEWAAALKANPNMATSGVGNGVGISSTQVYLPNAGYSVIRSGSTVSVIQTSRSK